MGFDKLVEDIRDAGRVITRHRAPTTTQGGEASSSRKKTGLSRHERARAMTDKQLQNKYQTSCQKLVKNGAAVFSSEATAVGSAKLLQADISFDRFEKSLEYSRKGMKQGIRSQVWSQELSHRGHQPAFGLLKAPESLDELKSGFRPYTQAAKSGGKKGFLGEAKKEITEYEPSVYTTLPTNTRKSLQPI